VTELHDLEKLQFDGMAVINLRLPFMPGNQILRVANIWSPGMEGSRRFMNDRHAIKLQLFKFMVHVTLSPMLSGEQGLLVNGKTIGADPNMVIELTKKLKDGNKYLDSHESILINQEAQGREQISG
jgi:hypothetical protein